ncbi:malonyl-CoA decarboxylase [Roseomonas sp. SSH11]|uniref:Malonyl-CoA decarboxylase n=1 Tax=Pararoseomonas baculiformis TaxID=2820812 RepID=A0ABS4AFJ4_9PROT|nr:malonyl-CoA decarboxylase [Pararoseomonas baculiformis]MBP0445771.1 malonyl-CoA decarboxylase [Pararoseomonas baculiformis]
MSEAATTIERTPEDQETREPAPAAARSWIERLWSSIADRGRLFASVPNDSAPPLERAKSLTEALLTERGEASGAAVAREVMLALRDLAPADRAAFHLFLATSFDAKPEPLREAAEAYLADPSPKNATRLARAAEPPRQELLRRMNMSPGGTAALVELRRQLLHEMRDEPALKPLEADLHHLFVSWFNRGFLQLRRIDWQTPAAVLEKIIRYEAVHEIAGWHDLRRRLAADRRCYGFFHPALPDEPLIFVEVALVPGLAASVQPLLDTEHEAGAEQRAAEADTAIFYSISNCQDGLRGISFGNFLIKQVVEDLKAELPQLTRFSTLSPIPGFRRWLEKRMAVEGSPEAELASQLSGPDWWQDPALADALRTPLLRLCAEFLTNPGDRMDPVARFHLGNGARLERINWLGNTAPRGMQESYGLMVNYLYEREEIERNHEAFARGGTVVRSGAVDALLTPPKGAPGRKPRASTKGTGA